MLSKALLEGLGEPHRVPCRLGAWWGRQRRQRASGAPWGSTPPLCLRFPAHGRNWSGWAAGSGEERTVTASHQPSLPGASGSPTLGPWGAPGLAVVGTTEKVGPRCPYPHLELERLSPQAYAAAAVWVRCRRGCPEPQPRTWGTAVHFPTTILTEKRPQGTKKT